MDILLIADERGQGDIMVSGGDVLKDKGLQTAIYISIFTEKGSWWADPSLGSELHTLGREKFTPDLLDRVKAVVESSLAWLIDEKAVQTFTVDVFRQDGPLLAIQVTAFRPDGTDSKYNYNWEAMK